ncbi:hypothetical protein ACE193_09615 [Bernardetia sp. OM2101]|uniref:hypothetical protein n=1 Tax=Bernardetia sp. OM2101 TaxID=3344876 RepID=UPI0035D0AA76
MKRIKKVVAISSWLMLCLVIVYQCFSDCSSKSEQEKAIITTHKKIRRLTKEIHNYKLQKADFAIYERGRNPRDIAVYNKIESAYSDLENLYKTSQINVTNLKSSLPDSAAFYIHSEAKKPVNTDYEILIDVYQNNLYQNAYRLLDTEYNRLYYSSCGFISNKGSIINANDTTLGFYSLRNVNKYIKIPKTTIEILNQKYTVNGEGVLYFDNDINKPTIFQVNTHTDSGIISTCYQIKQKKGQRLQPFDYKEIK